jgi:hypothetical protein
VTVGLDAVDERVGYVDLSAAQWRVVAHLAFVHTDKRRRSAISLEQGQGNGLSVRMTLCYEGAEHPHAAFVVDSGGGYRTAEP